MKRKAVEALIDKTRVADFQETDEDIAALRKDMEAMEGQRKTDLLKICKLYGELRTPVGLLEAQVTTLRESVGMLAKRLTNAELDIHNLKIVARKAPAQKGAKRVPKRVSGRTRRRT